MEPGETYIHFGMSVLARGFYLGQYEVKRALSNAGILERVDLIAYKILSTFNLNPRHLTERKQFIDGLNRWVNDPNALGGKEEAAKRIKAAFYCDAKKLKLSNLGLNILPSSIGRLTNLKALELYVNELTSLPAEIGNLNNLEVLHISENKLTSLPTQIGNLSNLRKLDAFRNRLTSIPAEIGNLSLLGRLSLGRNLLTSLPPAIRNLNSLHILSLDYNQFTSLPTEIGRIVSLTELSLSHNQLRALPVEIGGLIELSRLEIHHNNDLRDLPMSFGELMHITFIDTVGTGIPDLNRGAILAACRTKRGEYAVTELDQRLTLWKAYGKCENLDLKFIIDMNEEKKEVIAEWLLRLSKTREFSTNQEKLAETACEMLDTLQSNAEFADFYFNQAESNNAACGDRAAMAFNELYLKWRLLTIDKDATARVKAELIKSAARTIALRKEIERQIKEHRKQTGLTNEESVEIYLYYEVLLSDRLNLLTAVKSMLYDGIGRRDWINVGKLEEEVEAKYLDFAIEIPQTDALLRQDSGYVARLNILEDKLAEKMEKAEKEMSTNEYLVELEVIKLQRKAFVKAEFLKVATAA